jgi:glycosyltransferase involved in cell wall biosynthesis
MVRISAIVPAGDTPPTLDRCLAAIRVAAESPEEVIVSDAVPHASAAAARNAGAARATGDVLVFVDADVELHPDAVARIRRAFECDPDLTAVFGSYDDAPDARGVVSVFRNMLHHHVHQQGAGPATTFWAGIGAMRRDSFAAAGGFVEHPVEDIELGMRMAAGGAKIRLDPEVQGKHLKVWSLWSMVRTDLLIRGIPWVGLLLEHRSSSPALNLGWRHRLSALACLLLVAAAALANPWLGLAALAALVALNLSFYGLLARRGGVRHVIGGVALHVVHHLVAIAAVPLGAALYAVERLHARRGGPAL